MKDIEILKELQKLDAQIFKFKGDLKQKPQEIIALEEKFSVLTSTLKQMENDLKQVQLVQKEKELDLLSKEQLVDKQKSQLALVKSNKEYSALQLEIGKIKADNSLLEEEILIGLEKIDALKQSIAKEKEKLALEEKRVKQEKANIELKIKELNEQLGSLNAQRKVIIASGIKQNVLTLYERILQNRGEFAIVCVKDDACSGCSMAIRPQVVNELRMGKLLTCDNCSRILYVDNCE